MSNYSLRVSIVIPVYNEADHLADCLTAIANQTVAPYEVIVVDNNSTDTTCDVALSFPFVKLLQEPRQGVVFARDRGFNAARGAVIGRLDADSQITPDWVATLQHIFADKTVAATTGSVTYYGVAMAPFLDRVDAAIRAHMARALGREVAMQGANMAIRRSAWRDIKAQLCSGGNMHEDFDISVHLSQAGRLVTYEPRLQAAIDARRLESNWKDFSRYAWLSPVTYKMHGLSSHRHMYPVVALAILFYIPLTILRRGHNPLTGQFSMQTLLSYSGVARVNPATYVE